MNPRTLPPRNAPLFLAAAEQAQTPYAGFAAEFQELCSLAMDQAIGIEKASLAAIASFQSCAIDIDKNSSWDSPALGKLSEAAAQAIASCIELQLSWLALLASHTLSRVSTVAGRSGSQSTAADELAYSMDIAIGERFTAPVSTLVSFPVTQGHPAAGLPVPYREIAIAAQMA